MFNYIVDDERKERCGQDAAELNVVGGGELCNEGMLRKQGPTDSLTTQVTNEPSLLSLPLYVRMDHDMHGKSNRYSITVKQESQSQRWFLYPSRVEFSNHVPQQAVSQ